MQKKIITMFLFVGTYRKNGIDGKNVNNAQPRRFNNK